MKYAGMTKEEADSVSTFLSNNVNRHIVATRPLKGINVGGETLDDALNIELPNGKIVPLPPSGVGSIAVSRMGLMLEKAGVHESHHAAMLGEGKFDIDALNIKDPNLISGMQKFNKHWDNLRQEALNGLTEEGKQFAKDNPELFEYYTRAREMRSRLLTGLTEGYKPNDIPEIIDVFKPYIKHDIYKEIGNKAIAFAPILTTLGTGAMIGRVLSK